MKAIPFWRSAPVVLILTTAPGVAAGAGAPQSAPAAPMDEARTAEAYHQFLLGSFLEGEDNADAAIAAYRKALDLDPGAAGVAAELADLYVRLNRPDDAITAAQQALAIDPNNVDAHQTLGFVYAGMVDRAERGARSARAGQDENAAKAVTHLEQAVALSDVQTDPNVRATLARLYVRGEQYDKAIPLLTTLVSQEPGWRDGPDLLLQAFVGAGRTDDAIGWLEANAPGDPNLYPTLGDFYDRAHRWQDAADAYAEAIKVAPRNVELRTRYASSLMNAGGRDQVGQARDALTDALAVRPDDARVLYLLSQAERRLGDLAAAETTARRVITQDADSPWGYYALAESLEQRGLYADIVDALGPAVDRFRKSGSASRELSMLLPHLGFAYQETKQYDKAIATFQEARTLAPDDPSIVGYLVQANLAAKRYTQAASLAHDARAGQPDDLRLARLESQALVDGGKAEQGVKLFEEFAGRHGDDPTVSLALSQVYEDAKRGADAVKALEDARTRFPRDTSISFQLGAVLDHQKRFDEAEAAFRTTIEMDPEHAAALNYLGYMLAERGVRLDESVAYLKRALAIEPDNGAYLDSIGWAYFKADNLPLAEDNLRRAADQLRSNSVIQDHYGDVLARLERYADAIAAWTRALDGDGDSIDRRDIEKKIRSARQKLGPRQ